MSNPVCNRTGVEDDRDDQARVIDAVKAKEAKVLSELNKKIEAGKKRHENLTQEVLLLWSLSSQCTIMSYCFVH